MVSNNLINMENSLIIAEAGVNHNGDVNLAKKLIDAAKMAGADAVKFQNFKAERVISRYAGKAEYQKKSTEDTETQLSMLSKLELKDSDYSMLMEHAKSRNILFLSTPKDIPSAMLLEKIGMPIYKIGSSEVNNFDFLSFIASTGKPIILSTGMCTLGEVEDAIRIIKQTSSSPISLLHCVSQYPCPIEQVNLLSMLTMKEAFKLPVGYSDHTIGSDAILASVALGARLIEKHFTIDKNLEGPDHKVSMNMDEMKMMVTSIRAIESCLGDGIKRPAQCEVKNRKLLRRSLVFATDLSKGTIVTPNDITIKRPGTGLEPRFKMDLIERKLKVDVNQDEPVTWDAFL